jgi:hypothetical protein
MPAVLGRLTLDPGQNPLSGANTLDVTAGDVELVGERTSGVQAPGEPTTFNFTATNRGPGPVQRFFVHLGAVQGVEFTLHPLQGTVERWEDRYVWRVPALAVGETARLEGSAPYTVFNPEWGAMFPLQAFASPLDFVMENDIGHVNLYAAPEGTGDVFISDVRVSVGESPDQRVVTVTMQNAGPIAVPFTLRLASQLASFIQVRSRPLAGPWDCDGGTQCAMTEPLAPGAAVSVAFDIFYLSERSPLALLGAQVVPDRRYPDSRLDNNIRYAPATPVAQR